MLDNLLKHKNKMKNCQSNVIENKTKKFNSNFVSSGKWLQSGILNSKKGKNLSITTALKKYDPETSETLISIIENK